MEILVHIDSNFFNNISFFFFLTQSKSSHFGAPKNTAYRMGRRSSNAQLQSYLRKMSKSRRMIEHMEVEEYRLAHIMGHKELMAVSQQENNSVTT